MSLQLQAEDFFNAYEILHENNLTLINKPSNPASNSPSREIFGTRPAMGVAIVCLAFSVELYIKHLHHAISRAIPRGHDILKLFRELPGGVQQQIFTYPSIANYGWRFPEFEKEILAISDGFEKWRYSYEVTTLQYNSYFALVFIEAIKSVSASLHN